MKGWRQVVDQTEYDIYETENASCIEVVTTNITFSSTNTWATYDGLTIPVNYRPITHLPMASSNPNVNVRLTTTGQVQLYKTTSGSTTVGCHLNYFRRKM